MNRYYIATERADLFDVNMVVVISVDVIGLLEKSQIVDAFHLAVNTHEILRMHVVIDENGEAYYENCEESNNKIWFSEQSISEIINEQERIRFQIENGEFLRVVVNYSSEKSTITFLMHHLAGDGKSLVYFIESFMKALTKQEIEFISMKRLDVEDLPSDSKMPFFYKKYVHGFNSRWKKERKVFDFGEMDHAFNAFWNNHRTRIEISVATEKELQAKKEECHRKKIGLTSYLIAEFIKDTENKNDIGIAVDGRLDGNRCMGNQATGISVSYRYNRKKDLISNAAKIDYDIKKKLSNSKYKYFILHFMAAFDGTLIDAVNLEYSKAFTSKVSKKLATVLGYGGKTKDLSITNLTTIDIPTVYDELRIDNVIFVPPVISYGKNVVGIVTANNKMIIARHYYEE